MEFGAQQVEALDAIRDWLDDCDQGATNKVFRLFGYAGTGKTTLAKHIGDAVAVSENEHDGLRTVPQYAAYTGKAAVVMKRKGCANARTLHSLIYTSHDKSKERLFELQSQFAVCQSTQPVDTALLAQLDEAIAIEQEAIKQPGFALKPDALLVRRWDEDEHQSIPDYRIKMFIIDECSMVDTRLGQDLLSFNVPVLVLGDPAQLPPVGSGGFFTKQKPDFLLTDIHRQAEGDPIITLANIVREGGNLEPGTYGESQVCTKAALHQDDWLEADQILCGLNKTRHAINKRCRELLGFTGHPPRARREAGVSQEQFRRRASEREPVGMHRVR
jgi:exodeoxyribonuclease-5